MRILPFLLVLVLCGCGLNHDPAPIKPNLGQAQIIWSDRVDQDDQTYSSYSEVKQCLESNGMFSPTSKELPRVIIVDRWFYCGDVFTFGCTIFSENAVYVTASMINYKYTYSSSGVEHVTYVLNHELTHLLSGVWNEGHGNDANMTFFHECETHT